MISHYCVFLLCLFFDALGIRRVRHLCSSHSSLVKLGTRARPCLYVTLLLHAAEKHRKNIRTLSNFPWYISNIWGNSRMFCFPFSRGMYAHFDLRHLSVPRKIVTLFKKYIYISLEGRQPSKVHWRFFDFLWAIALIACLPLLDVLKKMKRKALLLIRITTWYVCALVLHPAWTKSREVHWL